MFNIKAIKEDFSSRCNGTNLLFSLIEDEGRLAKEEGDFQAVMLTLHEGKETSFAGIHPVFTFLDLHTGMTLNPELYVADYLLIDDFDCVYPVVKKLLSCIEGSDNRSHSHYDNFPVSEWTFQRLKKYGFHCFSSISKKRKMMISTEYDFVYNRVYQNKHFNINHFLSWFELEDFFSYQDLELISEGVNHQRQVFSIVLEVECCAHQEFEILNKIQLGGGEGNFIS